MLRSVDQSSFTDNLSVPKRRCITTNLRRGGSLKSRQAKFPFIQNLISRAPLPYAELGQPSVATSLRDGRRRDRGSITARARHNLFCKGSGSSPDLTVRLSHGYHGLFPRG